MTPLDLDGNATRKTLKEIDDENRTAVTGVIDTEGAGVVAAKTWRNGWGLSAYAKKKWRGKQPVEGGVRVSKDWDE